jgi:hypothetical protein
MEKRDIETIIDSDIRLAVHYEEPIDSLIELLTKAKEKGATHYSVGHEFDNNEGTITTINIRPETDEELQLRIIEHDKSVAHGTKLALEYEQAEYKRLKSKFEK